jgi:LysR family glycine cleavage system transcriptional activator
MASRFYNLPSLTALSAFEASARHGSFKAAASELNVTPGAVSHQIKTLEAEVGVTLFTRIHRGVELTDAGGDLFAVLKNSFSDIAATLYRMRNAGDGRAVTITATSAVTSLWLTPRMADFWQAHTQARVNQYVSDMIDPTARAADLIVKYGDYDDPQRVSTPLFKDVLIPLCAPDRFEELSNGLEELAQLPLIHLNADNASWTNWKTWFSDLGYDGPIARERQVNTSTVALQAAQAGAGVVLGWKTLVDPLLAQGVLVTFGPFQVEAPASFNIYSDPDAQMSEDVRRLKSFLMQSLR